MERWWVLVFAVLALIGGYKGLSQRIGSGAARRRLSRVIPLLVVGAAMVYFSRGGGTMSKSVLEFLQNELPLALAAVEWYALISWPARKRKYGSALQDLGPHPARRTMLVMAISGVLGGAASLLGGIEESGFRWSALGAEIFLFSSAIVAWAVARSRVYATARGIVRFDHQFEWNAIQAWQFERGGTVDLLKLRVRTRLPWARSQTLEVPVQQRPLLEQQLREHDLPAGEAPRLDADPMIRSRHPAS